MANVLDLRRRIRSVKNTRQITKAMKMVSAAKLRRAQERAVAARPYAAMITSVLNSLTRRAEIYDPATGNLRHPLFITRPEKRVLLVVVTGDKGFAGAFNANILKTAFQFIKGNPDKDFDLEAVGRKGRDQLRRHYPAAVYTEKVTEDGGTHRVRERKTQIEVTGDHPGMLEKLEASRVFALAQNIIARYVAEEIGDYAAAGGGKTAAADRHRRTADCLRGGTNDGRTRARGRSGTQRRCSTGRSGRDGIGRGSKEIRHRECGLHLRAAGGAAFQWPAAAVCFVDTLPRDDGIGCGRARRAHDGDGFGDE